MFAAVFAFLDGMGRVMNRRRRFARLVNWLWVLGTVTQFTPIGLAQADSTSVTTTSNHGIGPRSSGGDGWNVASSENLDRVGGPVSAPIPLNSVIPEFPDEARAARYQGICLVSVVIDSQGNPQNPKVTRSLGMGLDEKAIEAVRKYKFKPAMRDGKTAVSVRITIVVTFRL